MSIIKNNIESILKVYSFSDSEIGVLGCYITNYYAKYLIHKNKDNNDLSFDQLYSFYELGIVSCNLQYNFRKLKTDLVNGNKYQPEHYIWLERILELFPDYFSWIHEMFISSFKSTEIIKQYKFQIDNPYSFAARNFEIDKKDFQTLKKFFNE